MHIFGLCTIFVKICIETQFKFLWFWPSKTSLWDSMMLILAAREILYTGPLISFKSIFYVSCSILNKLTPEKFDKLSLELLNVGIDTQVILKGIILLVSVVVVTPGY